MATKRMLIDASHPEETRVVVVDGNRVEDYDVEVASRRQLRGNIYLAKVTRVEPSLQAAFIDYGGNRHGFLAFNEIHPDYYQIPIADRERLLAEQAAAERAAESAEREQGGEDADAAEPIGTDEDEEVERRRIRPPSRYYKIQEVVKRRQIMLVQVAKEERGNKGAALTTYLSLAGRYCVLMPNTSRGGGISRKIAGVNDRKRLKKILTELEVPDGMAVIVRTAGSGRSKAEIKRDYEYLVRLWSSIREITLQSAAPTLVHEEASLIKRSIRDLYGRDIEEIIVQGDEEYRIAKEFMKLFISSHAKRVKLYEDADKPLFQQFGVEEHLDSMHQPTVQLRSGGYVVINPTEALVAIDVNSGRSTRERNIEETALRTNLEAADEIAKQLRLRDLAGLIVVDFIDMENPRNQGMVERRLKEAMKNDRARVQIGRISPFGLLELSRQRLRPSLIETCFEVCPACGGNGLRRTTESTALAILRKLEEEGIKHRVSEVSVAMPPAVAMYLLNQKRRSLLAIEDRYGMSVGIAEDPSLVPPDHRIERLRPFISRPEEEVAEAEEEPEVEPTGEAAAAADREEAAKRGRRRRPRRRRGEEEAQPYEDVEEAVGTDVDAEAVEEAIEEEPGLVAEDGIEQPGRRRRRRGKRGARRRARMPDQPRGTEAATSDEMSDNAPSLAAEGFGEQDEAQADRAAMTEVTDEESTEQIETTAPTGTANRAAFAETEAGEDVSPQRRQRRRGGRRSRARKADESMEDAKEPAGAVLAAQAASATLPSDAASLALVSALQSPPDDAHAAGEAPATGVAEAESAWAARGDDEPASDEERASWAAGADEIVAVGGARPPIEEPDQYDALQHETEETHVAPVADAPPSFDEADDARGRRLAANNPEVVIVGEVRPPDERVDLRQPPEVDAADASDTLHAIDEPEPARHGQQYGDLRQPDDGPLPVEPSQTEAVSAHPDKAGAASEEEGRTEVVRVGEGEDHGGADEPRRGWWQRLLS